MAKKGTSSKRSALRKPVLTKIDPFRTLRNPEVARAALFQAIADDDMEAFRDVLIGHLRSISPSLLARKSGLGRQTLYDIVQNERAFDIRVSSLAKLLKAMAA